jgi:hypothetical protein
MSEQSTTPTAVDIPAMSNAIKKLTTVKDAQRYFNACSIDELRSYFEWRKRPADGKRSRLTDFELIGKTTLEARSKVEAVAKRLSNKQRREGKLSRKNMNQKKYAIGGLAYAAKILDFDHDLLVAVFRDIKTWYEGATDEQKARKIQEGKEFLAKRKEERENGKTGAVTEDRPVAVEDEHQEAA